jgi:protein-tyrosine phosphatase
MLDFDAIDDTLIVGSAFARYDVPLLAELGVGAVVSLQAEAGDPTDTLEAYGILWERVPCEDFHAPSLVQIDRAVAAVRGFVTLGRRVYLHCFAGLQRSVTIGACYLIAADPNVWNASTALATVCARRRNACPLGEQIDAVIGYDRMVRGLRR